MTYDKKTGTVTTNGDPKQFENDLFAHIAHVRSQVDLELKKKQTGTFAGRLNNMSRPAKIAIVAFTAWTLFVAFRTSGRYELLGFYLRQWDDNYFLLNWLALPIAILVLHRAIRWAIRDAD